MKRTNVMVILIAVVIALCGIFRALATSEFTSNAWRVITISTGAETTVNVPEKDLTIAHLGLQSDGTTASASGDYIVVMNAADTMDATLTDGVKLPILPGGTATFNASDVTLYNGVRTLKIQAVGHSAKIVIVRGR